MHLSVKQLKVENFTHGSQQVKLFPRFSLEPPRQRKRRHFPQTAFFKKTSLSLSQKGEENYVRKVSFSHFLHHLFTESLLL